MVCRVLCRIPPALQVLTVSHGSVPHLCAAFSCHLSNRQNTLLLPCAPKPQVLTVSRGSDIPQHARELAAHFATAGTPVMIGGGARGQGSCWQLSLCVHG